MVFRSKPSEHTSPGNAIPRTTLTTHPLPLSPRRIFKDSRGLRHVTYSSTGTTQRLTNIEHIWLGGFRGIFSQHQRRTDLLARFQKSFQNMLDKHLPSRRQVRGKRSKAAAAAAPPKISLDPRILELFVGLGDATEQACDMDDALNDLLYFVVDILQFHGERNAYDEIDFDSMAVETLDALHSYHAAVKSASEAEDPVHTVLILDKSLHVFPWESLPCMQGHAVSRVPSLACLRRLILEQQQQVLAHARQREREREREREAGRTSEQAPGEGQTDRSPRHRTSMDGCMGRANASRTEWRR